MQINPFFSGKFKLDLSAWYGISRKKVRLERVCYK